MEEKCFVQKHFIKYFFILLFLLCFVTPVLITFSLNVFITFAVTSTTKIEMSILISGKRRKRQIPFWPSAFWQNRTLSVEMFLVWGLKDQLRVKIIVSQID